MKKSLRENSQYINLSFVSCFQKTGENAEEIEMDVEEEEEEDLYQPYQQQQEERAASDMVQTLLLKLRIAFLKNNKYFISVHSFMSSSLLFAVPFMFLVIQQMNRLAD